MSRAPLPARYAVVIVVVLTVAALSVAAIANVSVTESSGLGLGSNAGADTQAANPYDNATVVTTSERKVNGDRANVVVALARNGSELYRNDSYRVYNDVDPVPGTRATVEYVAANRLTKSECDAETECWKNVFERANMTTGETTRVYTFLTSVERGQLHDMDRISSDRLLVGDIARDRTFVVNTTSQLVEWEWQAQSDFPFSSGGPFPRDWTHLNDVESLEDGRIVVSLRNHDQVVFLDRETGVVENWTLGSDDDHDVLYEQHNPDYIPASEGGPALLLANSENDRVAEFRREDGEWNRTWTWADDRLEWPRDADRLPNGHTLVTDTDGGRVLEIDRDGDIAWSVEIAGGYDAERLGTGDESAGGPSASERTTDETTANRSTESS